MMLERHARYMPVMNQKVMMGVISLYDVAKAVVDSQNLKTRCSRAHPRLAWKPKTVRPTEPRHWVHPPRVPGAWPKLF
jgi:hypothetical protein